jgi:benzoate/toluate 1,2-dioxygenase beta subunit
MNMGDLEAAAAGALAPGVLDELREFAFEEVRLLDSGQYEAWVDLFADDGVYWVPSEPGQASPEDTLSLFHETRPLLQLRARRLSHPQTHIQAPPVRTHHHLSNLSGQDLGGGKYLLRSMLLMVQWRNGEQRLFSAACEHRLRRTPAGLRIARKRVDLLDCDAPHRAFAIPF